MKKLIYVLVIMVVILSGCSPVNPAPEEKSTDVYFIDELEDNYTLNDDKVMVISYWFSNAIIRYNNTSYDFCSQVFEGDLVALCNEDKTNIFPADFSNLEVIRLIDNSVEGVTLIDVETKYASDDFAYLFHLEVNTETMKFTGFTYEILYPES